MKPNQGLSQNSTTNKDSNRKKKKVVQFTPILMTYTKLQPRLLNDKLVEIYPLDLLQTPNPKNYDRDTKCDHHNGIFGNSTERCLAFKRKVQSLLNAGYLSFSEETPNGEGKLLSG